MGGNRKVNSDLDILGKIKISIVPNNTGTVLTYNTNTKEISTRSNAEVASDLGLVTTSGLNTTLSGYATQTWANSQFIPKSEKGTANGVATLDNTTKIHSSQIPDRLVNKIIAIGGEGIDTSFTGLYDRNMLTLADKEHTVVSVLSGAGTILEGINQLNNIIFNANPDFVGITGCDATTELEITITFNSVIANYSRGLWQPFVQTRLQNSRLFRNIIVEVMDNNNVWYSPPELNVTNITTIPNSGLYLFPESLVGTANVKAVRFKLSNVSTHNGVVYLSNIGFRHVSHEFAPQYAHRFCLHGHEPFLHRFFLYGTDKSGQKFVHHSSTYQYLNRR